MALGRSLLFPLAVYKLFDALIRLLSWVSCGAIRFVAGYNRTNFRAHRRVLSMKTFSVSAVASMAPLCAYQYRRCRLFEGSVMKETFHAS
jgi:hypothetical protein